MREAITPSSMPMRRSLAEQSDFHGGCTGAAAFFWKNQNPIDKGGMICYNNKRYITNDI